MKFFATTVALAAAVAAEADPQVFLNAPVVSSPLLKTIIPAVHYAKPVAVAYNQVPFQTQYVQHATQYVATKPAEKVETVEIKPVEHEQKVVSYATNPALAYAQPMAYQPAVYAAHQQVYAAPQVAYAAQPQVYAHQQYAAPQVYAHQQYAAPLAYAAAPAQKVYHAKNGAVEHTVISKREAEAEPIDFVNYKTGPLSSITYPTLKKTLSAYQSPVYGAQHAYAAPAVAYNGFAAPAQVAYNAAPAVAYNTAYKTPVYAGQYAHQYATPQVYANQYQYGFPTHF